MLDSFPPGAILAAVVLAAVGAPLWIGYWRLQAWLEAKREARAAQRKHTRVMAEVAEFDRREREFEETVARSLKAPRAPD